MRLVGLEAKNFRSFAELSLDLNASGVFAITGANGAGKSTIFAAIEWALYGARGGPGSLGVAREGVRREECEVTLEFEVGGRLLQVTRIDGKDAWLTDVAGEEQIAHTLSGTSQEVAVRLGLTKEMFRGTFYAPQKEVEALGGKDAKKRKDQLERLLGIRHLRRAVELAQLDAREQGLALEALRSEAPDAAELKAEVKDREKEAREAAPAVKRLKKEIAAGDKLLKETNREIDRLSAQVAEHASRQLAAEQAKGAFELKKESLEGKEEQLRAALAAKVELTGLEAALRKGDGLEARERELDLRRQNHERRQGLVARERAALEELAVATDSLALARRSQEANEARRHAADLVRAMIERLEEAKRGGEIERELAQLAGAKDKLESSRARQAELRVERAEANAEIAHHERHREAVAGDGEEPGVCPTCHQELKGTVDDLIEDFDTAIAEATRRREERDGELGQLEEAIGKLEGEAERELGLHAERQALGEIGEEAAIVTEAARAGELLEEATAAAEEIEAEQAELEETTPELQEAVERWIKADQQARFLAEQLAEISEDGYDAEAHSKVRAALAEREEKTHRMAVVRDQAASAELLEKQVAAQRKEVGQARKATEKLQARARKGAPEPGAQEKMSAERDSLEEKLKEAREELDEATRRASAESEAVATARSRLEDAGRLKKRIDEERREFELRAAVAASLEEYREESSRSARPMLETEASKLLREITAAAYPRIRLTEDYLLEIAEGRDFHLSRRFSGGEQDLAALCLRLALARTLAHQRGTEHSFVILDEVFGSQDAGRRRMLMEQLTELSRGEFQQIFVISHTDDIVDQCSLHIAVARENGVSRAVGPTA